MKKLSSTWYNMVAVLTTISVVAGAALGYVDQLTAGPIQEIKAQQLSDGIRAVLGSDDVQVEDSYTLPNGSVVYRTTAGMAVQASDGNAFGGTLTVLVGFGQGGVITGYKVLQTAETPGLGAKADTWFQAGGRGCIVGQQATGKMAVKKDGGQVDAITASTITSRAFLRCVNRAYEALNGTDAQTESTKQVKQQQQ